MRKTLPGYMILALYSQFDLRMLQNEVEVSKSALGWAIHVVQILKNARNNLPPLSLTIRFQVLLDFIPGALKEWAEDDPDIKRILVEVDL